MLSLVDASVDILDNVDNPGILNAHAAKQMRPNDQASRLSAQSAGQAQLRG
jgi:hypothetical protein